MDAWNDIIGGWIFIIGCIWLVYKIIDKLFGGCHGGDPYD